MSESQNNSTGTSVNNTDKQKLEVLLAQWNKLNDKVENIEQGHWTVFTILLAGFGLGLFSKGNSIFVILENGDVSTQNIEGGFGGIDILYWIIPLLMLFVVCYEAYKLREFAVLRGCLAKIEDKINAFLSDDYLMNYFSKYKMVFISNNNSMVSFFPVIAAMTELFLLIICYCSAGESSYKDWYAFYLVVIAVISLIAIASIKKSEAKKAVVYSYPDNELKSDAENYWKKAEHK